MGTWNDLLSELEQQVDDNAKSQWILRQLNQALDQVGSLLGDRNTILYGSAFLQKPNVPQPNVIITHEDINGFMSVISGLDRRKPLTLILHTPGGVVNATESIVSYLRSCFDHLVVIVPTYAMSAGTMISLASDEIYLTRHGQLGPIDPQMPGSGGRSYSARAIVDQFTRAKDEIIANPANAHAWAPVNSQLAPALLQEAQNALDYSVEIVGNWLASHMLKGVENPKAAGEAVAAYFNDNAKHKSHGRRIGLAEARAQGLKVHQLEDNQTLQESVLTAYHLMTLMFEHGPATKLIWASNGRSWVKSWAGTA